MRAQRLASALVGLHCWRGIASASGDGLQLRHLQVVHRHGDRTPVTPLADRAFWASVLPSDEERESLATGTEVVRASDSVPHPAAGDGLFGTLSARGVQQMKAGGEMLRCTYPEFIPEVATAGAVSIYSTDFPRTIQSVQALCQGLFPVVSRRSPIQIDATRGHYMIPDPVPRLTTEQEELEEAVLASEAVRAHADAVEPLRVHLSDVLHDTVDPRAYTLTGMGAGDVASGHLLSWNKLAEIMKCLHAYGRLPTGLTEQDVQQASAAGAHRWTVLMRDKRIAHLAMGQMASDIVTAARDAARDASTPRLVVWSAHDSTIFGLLAMFALDAPATWPPYASQLHIELLEELVGSERPCGLYVRFSLNGEALGCGLGGGGAPGSSPIVALDEVEAAVLPSIRDEV